MKNHTAVDKASHKSSDNVSQRATGGENAAAIAPPDYGIGFVDNAIAATDPVQRMEEPAPNRTGMPDQLKSGIESLSGMDMSDVRVHYNSSKPAQLNASAYAQGNQIHLGTGQERHLPHEAWHVVQQRQGRVKPAMQMAGEQVNDDVGLEKEADVMGERANVIQRWAVHDVRPAHIEVPLENEADFKGVQSSRARMKTGGGIGGLQRVAQSTAKVIQRSVSFAAPSDDFTPGTDGDMTTQKEGTDDIWINSPAYKSSAKVKITAGNATEANKWYAGHIQTLVSSTRTGFYKKGAANHQKLVYTVPTAPIRDGDTGLKPWYDVGAKGKANFTTASKEVEVELSDAPREIFPWASGDGDGKLDHVTGKDTFKTWIIALNEGVGDSSIEYLKYETWEVDFATTFKYASTGDKEADVESGKVKNTGSGAGDNGGGAELGDPVANTSQKEKWEVWST